MPSPSRSLIRPELSAGLADVVALSVSKRPETRYQDGNSFAIDLRNVLAQWDGASTTGATAAKFTDNSSEDKTIAFNVPATQSVPDFAKTMIQPNSKIKKPTADDGVDLDL